MHNSTPRQVIFVVTQLERGGAQAAVVRLAEEFNRRGIKAEAWFLYRKTDAFRGHPLVRTFADRRPVGPFQLLQLASRFYRALKVAKPDALVSFTHYANVVCQPIAAILGIRARIASQRNPLSSYPKLAAVFDKVWNNCGVYTGNTAVSKATFESFEANGDSYMAHLTIIPNGLPSIKGIRRDPHILASLGIPEHDFVILAAGRLVDQKNHSVLIRAMALVPNGILVIAGAGPLLEELKALAVKVEVSRRVFFVGEIAQDLVMQLLYRADCYVMPSLFEGMSNALLEALAYGQVILASDIKSQREVLTADPAENAGILLPAQDVKSWGEAISSLQASPEKRERLSKAALRTAKLFTIERAADSYLALISARSNWGPND